MGGNVNQKHLHVTVIYLWSQVVCFVLSQWDLPNHVASCHALGIFGKLLMSRGASMRFETVWSYSVEPYFQWKLNKIETKNCTGIWNCPWWVRFNRLISQFSELRCGRYYFLRWFCCWKFKQIAKIGFGKQNQLSPQCVHIAKLKNFNSENLKNTECVHGPTTHDTLVKQELI
jgi:hypothetical protein